jgi:hypothetical protein
VLSKGVKDAAQAYAQDAQDQAARSLVYANALDDVDMPGGASGDRVRGSGH